MYVIKAIDRWCWSWFGFYCVWEMDLYFLTWPERKTIVCACVCTYIAIYLSKSWAYQSESFNIMLFLSFASRASHDSSRIRCILWLYWCFWVEPRWWWLITFHSIKIISFPEVFVSFFLFLFCPRQVSAVPTVATRWRKNAIEALMEKLLPCLIRRN